MKPGPVLAVPAFEKGGGGGHLVRSAALVRDLRSAGREAWLCVPGHTRETLPRDLPDLTGAAGGGWFFPETEIPSRRWSLIILDRFKTSPEEYARWSALGPVLGIDEGGPVRDNFDFLIDPLPTPPGARAPNMSSPALIPLPKNRRPSFVRESSGPFKILVTFGAEDPAELAAPVARACIPPERPSAAGEKPPAVEITLVAGPLGDPAGMPPETGGLRVLRGFPELRERLADYDLAITHFGLTAFEALHGRTPVILVSPGTYHEKLARRAGFVSMGTGGRAAGKLRRWLYKTGSIDRERLRSLGKHCENLAGQYGLRGDPPQSLGTLAAAFDPRLPRVCPACGSAASPGTLARFPDRTYRRCARCGLVYMLRVSPPPVEYAEEYFFESYKKQYGKTYLEDFPRLVETGKTRLRHIKGLLAAGEKPRLLDIGCAYGPFLAAAGEAGFAPLGIDPAAQAVRYVSRRLGIPALEGFFPDPSLTETLESRSFDAVSLWYVVEHFEDPGKAFREINRLLKPGGIAAFSTPSLSGISGRRSLKGFLEKSPPDHWTIWTPRHCGKILSFFGFELKKVVITGHHPERFPGGRRLSGKPGPAYRFFDAISRILSLGDTFEVYARKVREAGDNVEDNFG